MSSHISCDIPISLELLNSLRKFHHDNHVFQKEIFVAEVNQALEKIGKLAGAIMPEQLQTERFMLCLHYYLALISNIDLLVVHFEPDFKVEKLNTANINSTNIYHWTSLLKAIENYRRISTSGVSILPQAAQQNENIEGKSPDDGLHLLAKFNIQLTGDQIKVDNEHIYVPMEMLETTMNAQGRFDFIFVSTLCAELNRALNLQLHHFLMTRPLTHEFESSFQTSIKLFSKRSYTDADFENHMQIFSEEQENELIHTNLIALEELVSCAVLNSDEASIQLLKKLFICLLGHTQLEVREKAIIYLNVLNDKNNWQLKESYKTRIATIGDEFSIQCMVETNDEKENLLVLLYCLPFDGTDSLPIQTWHKPEVIPCEEDSNLKNVKANFLNFSRVGFYDWKLVKITKEGKFDDVFLGEQGTETSSEGSMILVEGSNPKETNTASKQLAQGRIIVHPKNTKDLDIHEINADFPTGITEEIQKDSFSKISKHLSYYTKAGVNCLYIMGALERDYGMTVDKKTKEKTFKKTKVLPLSVTCRKSVSSYLGGSEQLKNLIHAAKEKGIKVLLDCVTQISASRANNRYKGMTLQYVDEKGRLQYCYGSKGRARESDDTFCLNYRRKDVWDLLVEESIELVEKYNLDGLLLDDIESWGQFFEIDQEEMIRSDTDEADAYTVEAKFYGEIIRKDKLTGYWATGNNNYANPMIIDFCRRLWQKFPNLLLIGETFGARTSDREVSLICSGVVPRMYNFSPAVSSLFGKHIDRNGMIFDRDALNVHSFRIWYNTLQKQLPKGSIVIQSIAPDSATNPALIFKNWAKIFINLMFFFPHVPMTSLVDIQNLRLYRENHEEPETLEDADKLIYMFYKQARYLRHKLGALKHEGQLIPLLTDDSHFPFVLVYARTNGKDVSIVAANFNRVSAKFGISMKKLKFLLNGFDQEKLEHCVIKVSDYTNETTSIDYYTAYEFVHGKIQASLEEYTSFVWTLEVITDDKDLSDKAQIRSIERIKEKIIDNQTIEGHQVTTLLVKMVRDLDNVQDFINNLGYLYENFFKLANISIPHVFNLMKEFTEEPGLFEKLLCFCTLIKRETSQIDTFGSTTDNDDAFTNATIGEQSDDFDMLPQEESLLTVKRTESSPSGKAISMRKIISCDLLLNSKETESKTIYDVANDILSYNTLGSIAFLTPELGRWSAVGGLGVMIDELSIGLAQLGEQVICISPYYEKNRKGETGYLAKDPDGITYAFNVEVTIGNEEQIVGVHHGTVKGVDLYFLHHPMLFPQLYCDGDAHFTMKQMVLMAKASLQVLARESKAPSIVATNDWFTGLVAAYAKQDDFKKTFKGTKFIHIIHNLDPSYEGRLYPSPQDGCLEYIHNLPSDLFVDPYWNDVIVNPSRCAILSSDLWATVSNGYKQELLESSALRNLLKIHSKPFAISNGILKDARFQRVLDVCNNDHLKAKEALQKKYFGFKELDNSYAIFGFVGRITQQKGVHLILEMVEDIIYKLKGKAQFIIGGLVNKNESYGAYCAELIQRLTDKYPTNFWARPFEFFTDGTLLNAGSDFGLMPSLFEPGGIVQHEFFVGSTPVVAFQTGGLKDTVFEFDADTEKGNGFIFNSYCLQEFTKAVERAYAIYTQPSKYDVIRKNAFESTIGLDEVARKWNHNFYRMCSKYFVEQKTISSTAEKIKKEIKRVESQESFSLNLIPVNDLFPENVMFKDTCTEYQESTFVYKPYSLGKLKNVLLVGCFNNWKNPVPLTYDEEKEVWTVTVNLRSGEYFYKFIVDGDWVCSDISPKILDLSYNLNNYVSVL